MKPEQAEIDRLKKEEAKLRKGRDTPKKGRGLLCQGVDVKFGFVAKHREAWPSIWCARRLVSREAGSTLG